MSEYQYYEFQAIDRPLDERARRELRACSTRATITSTRFVNHYECGDLKGDPWVWMERYFDAFIHVASWVRGGSCCASPVMSSTSRLQGGIAGASPPG